MISNLNEIKLYVHCGLCLKERPAEIPPKDYSKLEIGWTEKGIQVWCCRHEANVMHIDFQGHTHPANTTRHVGSDKH